MSDRLAVMNRGRVEQLGAPKDVYEEPETVFVADFLGISNLLSATASGSEGGGCRVRVGEFELLASRGDLNARGATRLVIRPERVRLEPHASTGENRVPGLIERIVYRGSNNQVFVRLAGGEQIQALVQNSGQEGAYAHGDPVRVHLPAEALRVLAGGDGSTPAAAVPEAEKLGTAIGGEE